MAVAAPPKVALVGGKPIIDYVTKDYDGFRQGMLDQIALLLPTWTDRSESDFGVVLIELFAYVADILSYYQDRIANEAYLDTATQRRSVQALLRLIGYQIDPGLSATASIHFDVTVDVSVGGASIPYRLKTAGVPGEPDRIFEITQPFDLKLVNASITVPVAATLAVGSAAIIVPHASHNLVPGMAVYLEEKTSPPSGPQIRRSPMLTVTSVTPVPATTNDAVTWTPPLTEGYDPTSTKLKGNNVVGSHGQTLTDEPVYVGTGAPRQSMTLTRSPVSFLLSSGTNIGRQSGPELQVRVDGVLWEEVQSFFASTPFDMHYVVQIDENDKCTIEFGTGQRGAVPPAGSLVTTVYRIGLGRGGNVGADTLTVAVTSVPGVKAITNPFNAAGGSDRETTEDAKISGPGTVISQERAVTLQDYELLSKSFAGVGKAKARVGLRGGYKVVQVFVAPEDPIDIPPLLPSEDLKLGLKTDLESRMPVNRMAGVDVLDPIYVPIDITVDVNVKAGIVAAKVGAAVRAALEGYLSFDAQDFGATIRIGEIYALLYPIDGVVFLQLKRVATSGTPAAASPCSCDLQDVGLTEQQFPYRGVLTINLIGGVA